MFTLRVSSSRFQVIGTIRNMKPATRNPKLPRPASQSHSFHKRSNIMKQQRSSSLSPKVAVLALALFGFGSFLGLTGEVQASPLALFQSSIAPVDRVGTGDYAIRVGRGTARTAARSLNPASPASSFVVLMLTSW
jgi:hypothetical protein